MMKPIERLYKKYGEKVVDSTLHKIYTRENLDSGELGLFNDVITVLHGGVLR